MLALLGKATKTVKAVNIGRKLLSKNGEKEQKKKGGGYSEPSSSLVPRGSAPKNTSALATVPQLAEVSEGVTKGGDDILVIKDTVISIHKILKTTFKNESILLKQRRKSEENRKRAEQEEELEAKKKDSKKEKSGNNKNIIPMSIMDRIKAFILGFVAYKLTPFIPQLLELVKLIPPVVDFFANTAVFLVDAFASFLTLAKKPIDWAKGAVENLGGEEALNKFEGLLSAFTTFANIAIIAGMASLGSGDGPDFGRKGRGGSRGKTTGIGGKGVGRTRTTSPAAARRFTKRFGRDAAEKRFGKDAVRGLGGKYGRSGATNTLRKGATGIANKIGGRGGVKALASLGKIGKFLKVPVIGSIISVVLSLMNGDPIQKALFKGVGSAVGGALGGLLSTAIGVPPLGLFLGGVVGDYVGDLFYTLFFGGGLKAAGSKIGKDLKGMFTGIGDGAKAIFSWVFGGGLLDLLKNVGGGLAKFALYTLNPGGLLWDIIKAGGSALKAVTGFIFGGGLFDLIKNLTGGIFKFVTYILNPGGLLFDALKQGGKIAKAIFDFAINAIGSTATFIKEWISGIYTRFIDNFPSIGIPEGWGIQTTLGKILGWIPFLKPYMMGGRLTAFPDLSMFVPGLGLPFFFAHLGKSMFPGSFFEGMPSGIGDAWQGAKNVVGDIKENIENTRVKAVEGTKRATGGFFDAITFNAFDFDKQNEVEKKEEGGPVGDTETSQEKKLERKTFKASRVKPDKVTIGKDIGGPKKLAKAGFNKKTIGYLAAVSAELKRIPLIGSIMGSAVDLILGQRPTKSLLGAFSTNIVALSDFATVDEVNQGSLSGLLSASTMQTGGEVFGSTYGPGTIAGERDSATGALLAIDPEQYQHVLSRYLETAVDSKVPNVFSAMNLAESMKDGEPGPLDQFFGGLGSFFGFGGDKKTQDDENKKSKVAGGGGGGGAMTMGSDFESTLAKLLKNYEGLRTEAYLDSVGIPTIGMGATYYPKGFRLSGSVQMGQSITEEEALFIKQAHIKEHRDRLLNELPSSTYTKVPDNVKAALESKVFNYGSLGGTLTELVTKATEDGNYKPVSEYFRNSLATHNGGINSWRRNDEAGIIDTGKSSRAGLSFPKESGSKATEVYEAEVAKASSGSSVPGSDTPDGDSSDDSSGSSGGDVSVGGETIAAIGKDLISQGFSVAEHPDFSKQTPAGSYTPGSGSVSNVHKGKGHYDGRAIDVTDWRGSLADSQARYRKVLDSLSSNSAINMLIHDTWGFQDTTGKSGPGGHGHPEHMHIETKMQGGGSIESRKSDTSSISDYASYEDSESGPQIVVKTIIVEKTMPGESAIMPIPLGGGGSSGGVNINAYSNLSAGAG